MLFREGNAQPAQVGHLGPDFGAVAKFGALVAESALAVHPAVLRNQLGRGPGQHVLGGGEGQRRHQSGNPSTRLAMMFN